MIFLIILIIFCRASFQLTWQEAMRIQGSYTALSFSLNAESDSESTHSQRLAAVFLLKVDFDGVQL